MSLSLPPGFAGQQYAAAKTALQPGRLPGAAADTPATTVAELAASFIDVVKQGEETAAAGLVGKADTLSVVEALAKSELAVETVVAVRNKIVEAYQEIMRMPV